MRNKLGMVGVSWGSPQPLEPLHSTIKRTYRVEVGVIVNIERNRIYNIQNGVVAPVNIPSPTPTFGYMYDNTTLTRLGIFFYPQLPQPR
jgi:hypothetical protein